MYRKLVPEFIQRLLGNRDRDSILTARSVPVEATLAMNSGGVAFINTATGGYGEGRGKLLTTASRAESPPLWSPPPSLRAGSPQAMLQKWQERQEGKQQPQVLRIKQLHSHLQTRQSQRQDERGKEKEEKPEQPSPRPKTPHQLDQKDQSSQESRPIQRPPPPRPPAPEPSEQEQEQNNSTNKHSLLGREKTYESVFDVDLERGEYHGASTSRPKRINPTPPPVPPKDRRYMPTLSFESSISQPGAAGGSKTRRQTHEEAIGTPPFGVYDKSIPPLAGRYDEEQQLSTEGGSGGGDDDGDVSDYNGDRQPIRPLNVYKPTRIPARSNADRDWDLECVISVRERDGGGLELRDTDGSGDGFGFLVYYQGRPKW
ncbi:hypothetical protein F5Y16DRAFT_401265 [Xylariaceae sp. FL0255]|nr:hypothetical protein F5Y16DRAFT_401265 [Xylariaceae sp. FL0255]